MNLENWKEIKNQQRNWAFKEIKEMLNEIKQDDNLFMKYLDLQSKFTKYSVGNVLLVLSKYPKAEEFRDKKNWKQQGVEVKKFEKPFIILEPTQSNNNGKVYYNAKEVFDISQTNLESREQKCYTIRDMLSGLINDCPVKIETYYIENEENKNRPVAYYDKEKDTLLIKKGENSERLIISLAYALSEITNKYAEDNQYTEFSNLVTTYLLCKKFGLNMSKYSEFNLKIPDDLDTGEIRQMLGDSRTNYEIISMRVDDECEKKLNEQEHQKQEINKGNYYKYKNQER